MGRYNSLFLILAFATVFTSFSHPDKQAFRVQFANKLCYTMIIKKDILSKMALDKTLYLDINFNSRTLARDAVTLNGYLHKKGEATMEPVSLSYFEVKFEAGKDIKFATYQFPKEALDIIKMNYLSKNLDVSFT